MKKNVRVGGWVVGLCSLLIGTGWAETNVLDFWAATEVVMGQVGPSTIEQIKKSPELQRQYERVLMEQYLAQQAVTRGLSERLDVQRALNVARRSVLVQALREDLFRSIPQATAAEISVAFPKDKDKWTLPAAYQLDVYRIAAADTPAHEAARQLATGKPVTEDGLSQLVNAQQQVTRASGVWLTEQQMTPTIWKDLALMKKDEVRLYPDGAQTLVIRRGDFRNARALDLKEASPYVARDLMRERSERVWSNYLDQARTRVLK
jgi:hypothetical protein